MCRAVDVQMQRADGHIHALEQRLRTLDPKQVLARGYAWITDDSQRPLVSVRELRPGQSITAVWSDGRARASVTDVSPDAPP